MSDDYEYVDVERERALFFVRHLENHEEVKNALVNAGKAMCKICEKSIDQIYAEET